MEDALRRIELSRGLFPWATDARVALAPVLRAMGETDAAREAADAAYASALAAESPRRIGGALRIRGLLEGGKSGSDLLRKAVETLAHSPALLWRAEAYVDLGTALRELGWALERLPRDQREALQMIVLEEQSYEDASEVTGCAIGTLKSRVHRARLQLRAFLSGERMADAA